MIPRSLALFALALSGACSTPYIETSQELERTLQIGDFEAAEQATAGIVAPTENDDYDPSVSGFSSSSAALIDLEMAVHEFAAGRPAAATDRTMRAKRKLDAMLATYGGESILSTLVTDFKNADFFKRIGGDFNRTRYIGHDWEHVMTGAFVSICALASGEPGVALNAASGATSTAEGWRSAWSEEKTKYEEAGSSGDPDAGAHSFLMSGLAFLLGGVANEADSGRPAGALPEYEETLRYEAQLANIDPNYPVRLEALQTHIDRANAGGFTSTDRATLWAVCGSGSLTPLVPTDIDNSGLILAALELARSALTGDAFLPVPKNLALGAPGPAPFPERCSVEIFASNNALAAEVPVVSDLQPVLENTNERTKFRQAVVTLFYRLVKKFGIDGIRGFGEGFVKDDPNSTDDDLIRAVIRFFAWPVEVILAENEVPDVRSWRLLPRQYHLGRYELEPGTHQLTLACNDGVNPPIFRSIEAELGADNHYFLVTIFRGPNTPAALYLADTRGNSIHIPPTGGAPVQTSREVSRQPSAEADADGSTDDSDGE